MGLFPGRVQDPVHRADKLIPTAGLMSELLATGRSEAIVAGLAIILGRAPEGGDPTAVLEAVQRRVQRSVFHLQNFRRTVLNDVRNRVAVRGPWVERLEDQQVQRSLEQVCL